MKAAIYTQYGGPEVVSLAEVPNPKPVANEVLIKVYATSVNRTDCGFRSAVYVISRLFSGLFRPKLQVLGCEFSGVIEAIGSDVSNFKVGDRVFGYDEQHFGGHAQYKTIRADKVLALIPDHIDFPTAAVLTEGSHYALSNIRAAKVRSDDTVLLNGSTGAIGSAALQLLKHRGAFVVAVCDSRNVDLVRSLGADEVIDYQTADLTQTAHRFDFVFDAVGKSSFHQCKPLLKPKGIYISTELGKRSANIWLALFTPLLGGRRVLFPIPVMNKEDLLYLRRLAASGSFTPVVDRTYPMDDIVDAYRYVETGQKIGNVIIQVYP